MIKKDDIKFQSYSWSYGTTSFRVSELKYKIERQLIRLKELRNQYPTNEWIDIQGRYFDILVEENLSQSTAINKAKDARQKTSALKDLGLITEDRTLTQVGEKLYKINKKNDFNTDNIFGIKNDNFIYFKQLLKMEFSEYSNSRSYSKFKINPFLSMIYFIINLKYITKDEFTYLLPLVKNIDDLKDTVRNLKSNRNFNNYKIIINKIKRMQNYKNALTYFFENEHNIDTFEVITMDRKSKKNVVSYFNLYEILFKYFKEQENYSNKEKEFLIKKIVDIIDKIPSTNRVKYYKKLLNSNKKPIKNFDIDFFENYTLINSIDEKTFFENIFYLIHSIKWHTNLEEYYDLNKRFLSLSDVFIFEDEKIYLDDIVSVLMENQIDDLLNSSLSSSKENYNGTLASDLEFENIFENFNYNEDQLLEKLKVKFPNFHKENNLKIAILKHKESIKIQRFNLLIDKKFSNENIIKLLNHIKTREDSLVKNYTDWECDVPTIFEYLVGILWYKVSNNRGNLSKFLNMSLDVNLLPIRFAGGGKADIVFEYENHHLMIEVTLSNKDNQRKMELEPVSRHLGRYKLNNKGEHYALFIAPHLDPNVLVGFRSYSKLRYYNSVDTTKYVQNLKIIPLNIDDIINILKYELDYQKFYDICDEVFINEQNDGFLWYKNILQKKLESIYATK